MNNGGGARAPRPDALVNLDSSVLLAEAGIKGKGFQRNPGGLWSGAAGDHMVFKSIFLLIVAQRIKAVEMEKP